MSLFKPAENSQAFAKVGFFGFAGAGKTYTATLVAIGLHQRIKSKSPIYMLDTETGSDWVLPVLKKHKIGLETSRTKAFVDLVPALREVEKVGGILIIDSITHFWRELMESYAMKMNRQRGLVFNDWAWLKKTWGEFTDYFVNGRLHIIMCGRAGYEFDFFEDESGKKELEKTGLKMKAEAETGFEPSLLVYMERETNVETKKVYRTAHVIKDRSQELDGQSFPNPTFESFKAHFQWLNLGGEHVGTDLTRSSLGIIQTPGKDWRFDEEQKAICLDEIEEKLLEFYPGKTKDEQIAKARLLRQAFGMETASWERIKSLKLGEVRLGYEKLKLALAELFPAPEIPAGAIANVDASALMVGAGVATPLKTFTDKAGNEFAAVGNVTLEKTPAASKVEAPKKKKEPAIVPQQMNLEKDLPGEDY